MYTSTFIPYRYLYSFHVDDLFKPSVASLSVASISASSRCRNCGQRWFLCMQRVLSCSRVVWALRPIRNTPCFCFSCKAVLFPRSRSLICTLAPPSAAVLYTCKQSSARRGLGKNTVRSAASTSNRVCSSVRVANDALGKAATNLPRSGNGCSRRGSTTAGAQETPLSAYLHLPFCKKKCYYCEITHMPSQ